MPRKPTISRGVRIEKALDPTTLIVWAMNGQPLPNIHGGPVRLMVPGWPGSASQKWLTKITIRDKEHDGPGMTEFSYRTPIKPMVPGDKGDPANLRILESMPVRAIITSPANGAKFAAGTKELKLRGASWAGDLTVKQVDVSTDFGASWQRATLEKPKNKYDWQRWTATLKLPSDGYFEIWTRATDFEGRDAAAPGRLLESAGLWRQCDAPHRGAGRMMLRLMPALAVMLWVAPALAQTTFTPREESPEEFVAAPGRDETFYACTACHGFKLVAQQGLSRAGWEDSLNLMVRKHNMPPLDDKDRAVVLGYLEAAYPPRAPAGRGNWQNPFAK